MKKFVTGIAVIVVLLVAISGGAISDRLFGFRPLDRLFPSRNEVRTDIERKILKEESIVIDVAENVSPSVVTVSVKTPERRVLEFSPFGGFRQRVEQGQEQDIGTGFIVTSDGLIVSAC